MGFNMFLADDLVTACTQRFKRSKIDGPTYRRALSVCMGGLSFVWEQQPRCCRLYGRAQSFCVAGGEAAVLWEQSERSLSVGRAGGSSCFRR